MNSNFAHELWLQFQVLPERLGGHIALSLSALIVGIVVSIPLGIYASRHRKLELLALTAASLIQTIPSLALLALMVFIWGTIGWVPALIALILYSVLPILRNTIIGLQSIDPAVIEAAQGVGMTQRQMLWMVQMPLAASTIIAGVRTAAVWVVGLATIAEPVGAVSLGNYIFVGLQTSNSLALLFGCVFSAGLALILDGLLRRLQNAVKRRDRGRIIRLAVVLALVLSSPLALALIKEHPKAVVDVAGATDTTPQDTKPYVIGGKAFTEQYILTQAMKLRLEAAGIPIELKDGLGSTILFDALKKGEVDCYVDYSGTLWVTVLKKEQMESSPEMIVDVASKLRSDYGIVTLGSLGFENTYAMAVRKEDADKRGLKSITDLAKISSTLRAGTEIEFFARPEWQRVQQLYGLDFKDKVTMDATLMYGAIQNNQLDVIIAFSTDGRIAAYHLTTLTDPRQAMPPYDAMVLLSPRAARNPAFVEALKPLLNHISTDTMRAANKRVDLDKESPDQSAAELLKEVVH